MAKGFKFKKIVTTIKCSVAIYLAVALCVLLFGCSNKSIIKKASRGLNSYSISATLCAEDMVVSATEVVEYNRKNAKDVDFVCFNLYGTAFSDDAKVLPYTSLNASKCFPNGKSYGDTIIESVRVDDENADFQIVGQDNNALQVNFDSESKDKLKIEIVFKTKLANCTHRLGYYENYVNLGNWYPMLAVYDGGQFNIEPYYSTGDPFFSECANYDVSFYYPQEYKSSHTGSLTSTSCDNGIVCDKYNAKCVRDFAMCLSKDFVESSTKVGETQVRVLSGSQEMSDKYLEVSSRCLEVYNSLFGKYPYETLDVAFTPFLHGGMEYPNVVFIASDIVDEKQIVKVVVHEIAHQWWYGIVGNNEIKDAWFDESLAEYSSLLFFEENPEYEITREGLIAETLQDYLLYIDVVKSVNMKVNEKMDLAVNEYQSEYEYVYMVYVKGMIFIDELRSSIGDEAFFNGLKKLYKNNMFKIVDKEKFIKAFNGASKVDVSAFVEGYLSGTTKLD